MASQSPATFEAMIPKGVTAGQTVEIMTPDGQTMQFTVPEGATPGMIVAVAYVPLPRTPVVHATPVRPVVAAPVAGVPPQFMGGMQMSQPLQHDMHTHVGYAPGAGGGYAGATVDGYAALSRMQGIRIKEKVQLAEILVGFEMPNKYMCADPLTNQDVFVAAEKSQGFMGAVGRQVFEGGTRPFNLEIATLANPMPPDPFLTLNRPFKCTCCCFQRPEVFINDAKTGQLIGSVIDPFACCSMTFDIKDASGEPILEIDHGCCDMSLLCWGCPCGCQEATFEIKDKATGGSVARIRKQFRKSELVGMVVGINTDADQYTIDFDDVANPTWKAIVLATALFFDFRFFTKGGQTQRDESALGQAMTGTGLIGGLLGGD